MSSPPLGMVFPLTEPTASTPKKSVKYLTCYYWRQGGCKKNSEECLYSHHDTGHYAEKPRPVKPGGRSVAGRNATLQLKELDDDWRSSAAPCPGSGFLLSKRYTTPIGSARQSSPEQRGRSLSPYNLPPSFGKLNLNNRALSSSPLLTYERPLSKLWQTSLIEEAIAARGRDIQPRAISAALTDLPSPRTDAPSHRGHDRRLTVGAGRPGSQQPEFGNGTKHRESVVQAASILNKGLTSTSVAVRELEMEIAVKLNAEDPESDLLWEMQEKLIYIDEMVTGYKRKAKEELRGTEHYQTVFLS